MQMLIFMMLFFSCLCTNWLLYHLLETYFRLVSCGERLDVVVNRKTCSLVFFFLSFGLTFFSTFCLLNMIVIPRPPSRASLKSATINTVQSALPGFSSSAAHCRNAVTFLRIIYSVPSLNIASFLLLHLKYSFDSALYRLQNIRKR